MKDLTQQSENSYILDTWKTLFTQQSESSNKDFSQNFCILNNDKKQKRSYAEMSQEQKREHKNKLQRERRKKLKMQKVSFANFDTESNQTNIENVTPNVKSSSFKAIPNVSPLDGMHFQHDNVQETPMNEMRREKRCYTSCFSFFTRYWGF